MYIYKVGVVGAGAMGSGIAQAISYAGIPVVLSDLNQPLVDRGMAAIRSIYDARLQKGKMTPEEVEAKMALVTPATGVEAFRDVDLVVEAVFEDLAVKNKLFASLHAVCPAGAILATNTSSLPISAMAAASGRPSQVIGIHFFFPAHVMKLIEIIPALQTSPDVVDAAVSFAESVRKVPVKVKECPGFLVNRLLMPYVNEACRALEEGTGSARKIDEAMTAFGMPMGPFLMLDSVGIDISYHVAQVLRDGFGPRAEIPKILEAMFRDKRWGRKTGAGFYVYDGRADDLDAYVRKIAPPSPSGEFNAERPLLSMLNEACRCLEEGVASPGDIDLALMAGIGFPQATQGLLHWADVQGLDYIAARLKTLTEMHGPAFWPSVYLQRLVHAGFTGVKAKRGFFEYT
jgi:3-hydroxyacyl-CoA dehydrogenase